MKAIYSKDHILHSPTCQIIEGVRLEANEIPERIENIVHALKNSKHEIIHTRSYDLKPILKVHSDEFVSFVEDIYTLRDKVQISKDGVIPDTFPTRSQFRKPDNKLWMAGWYCYDTTTPILEHTFKSAISSAHCALTGADLILEGEKKAYALCRPPGHHAGADYYGGFCYFNNSAIAAQHLHSISSKKVAILDIDYHHGNGTQDIFYKSGQVAYYSVHADPNFEYPYFSGYIDEVGKEEGYGANLNIPLPIGTGEKKYIDTLKAILDSIDNFAPEFLIVSLGVDTYESDPVSAGGFKLRPDTFGTIGEMISRINKPTLIIQEGGYNLEMAGTCVINFLNGFKE